MCRAAGPQATGTRATGTRATGPSPAEQLSQAQYFLRQQKFFLQKNIGTEQTLTAICSVLEQI